MRNCTKELKTPISEEPIHLDSDQIKEKDKNDASATVQQIIPGITGQESLEDLLGLPVPDNKTPLPDVVEYRRALNGHVVSDETINQLKRRTKQLNFRIGAALFNALVAVDASCWKTLIEEHFPFLGYQRAMHARRFSVVIHQHPEELENDLTYTEVCVKYGIAAGGW